MFIKRAYDALRLIWGDSPIYLWGRALTLDTVYLFCKISVNLPTHKSLPSKPNPLRRRSQPHPQRLHIRPKVTQPKHEAKHNPPKISRIYILVKRVAQIRSRFLGIFLIYTQGHESRRTFLRGVATRPRDHARSGHTSGRGNTSHWSRWSRRCDWSSALHPININCKELITPSNEHYGVETLHQWWWIYCNIFYGMNSDIHYLFNTNMRF